MKERTAFPPVFWIANTIEVLERFAYYGIYMGFGIYMEYLGYSKGQLGFIQTIFLLFSYTVPLISGTFADRFGFKKVLIVSYLAYLPSILLLLFTKSFSGIALTMLSIGLAAGIFKPLISGTVRAVTDKTNKTLGFGIFYQMVNVGASFGPLIAGKLRAISWDTAFLAAAVAIGGMLLITILFYKEPERKTQTSTLNEKFKDIWVALSDVKFAVLLLLLGLFFWIPFWAFFNLAAIYIDKNLDTVRLYMNFKAVLGTGVTSVFSQKDGDTWKLLGETIAHTGWIIMVLQFFVSRISEKYEGMSAFLVGLLISAVGFIIMGLAKTVAPALVILGIVVFAIGEMVSSPRIQEYITWIAPKEKAGLYMGTNFLATGIGAFSGVIYTPLYGYFRNISHPEFIWYTLAAHTIIGMIVIGLYMRKVGNFEEMDA